MSVRHDGLSVSWLGYATVRIETPDDFVVYLDPGRYGVLDGYRPADADLVCVTHVHHYDPDAIDRVADEETTLAIYGGVEAGDTDRDVRPVEDLDYDRVELAQEDRVAVGGAQVWTLPAYNRADGPHTDDAGEPYHPRGFGVGFLLSVGGTTVFWPGDSDVLEGHRRLEVSLFLPPIGGAFTMDRREAADLAETLDPDLVLPVHYDTFEALETDAAAFAADVAGRTVPVVLDDPEARP